MRHERSRQRPLLSATASRSLAALAAAERRSPSALVKELIDEARRRRASTEGDRVNDILDRLHREVTASRSEVLVAVSALYPFMRLLMSYTAFLPRPGEEQEALGEERFRMFVAAVGQLIEARVRGCQRCPDEDDDDDDDDDERKARRPPGLGHGD